MRAHSWTFAVAAIAAAGCRNDEPPSPPYTVVDSFDDCAQGLYFADCGGTDPGPVLGCEAAEQGCWWFATRTVPRDIVGVSSCLPDDICCEDDWPFVQDGEVYSAYQLFYSVGTEPWDREREMNLDVVIDPSIATPASTTVSCTGALLDKPGAGPCGDGGDAVEYALDTPAIAVIGPGNFYGWYPVIELDEADAGGLRARTCLARYTDTSDRTCPRSVAKCASSGSVTVTAWPLPPETGAPFHVDATFDDGSTLAIDGAVTAIQRRR